jgi:protein-L-isoaspartate(D-aspartate) O-methyltransferase
VAPFETVALVYFAAIAAAVLITQRPRGERAAIAGAVLAMAVLASARMLPDAARAWLGLVYLTAGYWVPALAAAPTHGGQFERWLVRSERRVEPRLASAPRPLVVLGELAYLLCYPFVPAAFAVIWVLGTWADVERFWLAVLIAGYACYASIPWLTARPPRLLIPAAAPAGLARANAALLSRVSHNLTTFPSGHVAVSLVAAAAVFELSAAIGAPFMAVAVLIAMGAAIGRYHFMVDVLSGVLVALLAAGTAALAQPAPRSQDLRRMEMVEQQIEARGVLDRRVLDAMRRVPRERFVPEALAARAYDDNALPIGQGQTISQPYIVAHMSELLRVAPDHKVLEIGTGSGYQAAILGELAREVYTIEIVSELAQRAEKALADEGYRNVHVRDGDGYAGWPEHAPFDRILLTAAPETIPQPLIDQLAVGGLLVAPVGAQASAQWIVVLEKRATGIVERRTIPVQFVPFTRRER